VFERVHVRFVVPAGIVQSQPGAEAIAIESKPAAPLGKLSVTVTREPSVGVVPVFDTVSVKVVAAPPTNGGECDFATVRSGASTEVTTCGLSAVSGVARLCAKNRAEAWLVIWSPTDSPLSIVTSKLKELLLPGSPAAASSPPAAAVAP
jgi:hypothetical protein